MLLPASHIVWHVQLARKRTQTSDLSAFHPVRCYFSQTAAPYIASLPRRIQPFYFSWSSAPLASLPDLVQRANLRPRHLLRDRSRKKWSQIQYRSRMMKVDAGRRSQILVQDEPIDREWGRVLDMSAGHGGQGLQRLACDEYQGRERERV